MIDLRDEQLIPLRDVPKWLPKRSNGKRLHISAVYRWVTRGVQGVRLETVKLGGTTYTSRQALQRFAQVQDSPCTTKPIQPIGRRQREIQRAAQQAKRLVGGNS